MKKIIVTLLCIIYIPCISQEIFSDINSQNQYLFLGGIESNKLKLLNLNNDKIEWINRDTIEPIDKLSSVEFLNKISNHHLFFKAEGTEPFWSLEIDNGFLLFTDVETGNKDKISIKTSNSTLYTSESIFLMFHNYKQNVYGVIRSLGYYPKNQIICNLCICEEESIFEVFINYKGKAYKGCALLTKK